LGLHVHNGAKLFCSAVFVKVLKYPHPLLKNKCKPLQKINQELRDIVAEMFEIMYAAEGVGLAANQVGLPFQLFVMNPTGNKENKEEEYVFINPVILKKSGNVSNNEGCLSFPDIHADVVRSETIEVESVSLSGEEQLFQWTDRPARIVQHEVDHLNGICFADRVAATAKIEIKPELDDLSTVFEGNQRLGFDTIETAIQTWKEYEQKFC
jgi:peptide deformylase